MSFPTGIVYGAKHLVAILLLTTVAASTHGAETNPVDLAVRFLTNVYTGVEMSPDQWLTESTRETHLFQTFGGLNAMVRQSTARAAQMGGFKAAVIKKSARTQSGYEATIEIVFNDPTRGRDATVAATLEDEIWNVRIVKEHGGWKIAL